MRPSHARAAILAASLGLIGWAGLFRPSVALAQDAETPPAGHISGLEGVARLEREGAINDVERGMPLVPGDRLRTEAGRLEVRLGDGSLLHLDRFSELDLPSDLVVRLARGRLLVTLWGQARSDLVSVEAPGAMIRFDGDGRYRIAVGGTDAVEVELAVLRGSAEIVNDEGALRLSAGQLARVHDGEAPSAGDWVETTAGTALDRWAGEQVSGAYQATSPSRSYLPSELAPYAATFDQYGTWQNDVSYGYVWYPSVAVSWRPYYHGRWHHVRPYGWTWIAFDAWGWPTHHYGRWHIGVGGSWFWIPAKHWGPAWVYWATTPTYVGWCPLGWNGRPVVNVFAYGKTHVYPRHRDPYRAWTVQPVGAFGRGSVPTSRVGRTVLDHERPTFVMQHVAPGVAPPRRPTYQRADGGSTLGAPSRRPGVSGPSASMSAAPQPGDTSFGRPRNPGYTGFPSSSRITDPGPTRQLPGTAGSPYDRAQRYADPRSDAPRAPAGAYRRYSSRDGDGVPSEAVPRRPTGRIERGDPGNDGGRPSGGRTGMGAPGYRAPESPGMSRPPDSGPRPGMSSPPAGYATPRDRGPGSGGRGGGDGSGGNQGGGDRGGNRGGGGDGGSRGGGHARSRGR